MSACVLSWAVLIALLLLISLVVMAGMALSRLAVINELWERVRDKVASFDNRMAKVETAMEWFLQKEGMKLDNMHTTWKWYVVPTDDWKLRDWLDRKDDRKREELAEAIYKAHLQAMRDHDKELEKKPKK